MAVNVKLGVDIGEFKSGIQSGQAVLRGLNAEMKATEAEFKATGNAEQMLANKTKTLNSQMAAQRYVIDNAKAALEQMTKAGVNPADVAYQKLYATMMNAEAGLHEAEAAMAQLGTGAGAAASGAEQLTNSMNGISKKISLEQVISGIDKITSGLENAAKKAVKLGEDIWNAIMDSAKRADDTATMAQMYGIDIEKFQQMQKLVVGGMDTSVESMLTAQDKLKKGIGKESKEVIGYLEELGVSAYEMYGSPKYGEQTRGKARDTLEVFWETGQALLAMSDAYDKEAAAQALFGKSWKELIPLFTEYKTLDEYNAALAEQNVVSEESVNNLAELNDKVGELQGNFNTLKDEVIGQLAPGLTAAADALNNVLTTVLKYLKTEEGQEMLQGLSESVSKLFEDLGNIDPGSVVESFTSVFNGLVDGLKWIVNNKDTLITALGAVVAGWAGLKITGGALQVINMIDGLKGLGLFGGGAASGTATGTAAGAGTGTAAGAGAGIKGMFTNALKVAPFALPALVAVDSVIDVYKQTQEALEKGQASIDKYGAMSELYGGTKAFETWSQLYGYQHIRKGGEGSGEAWEDMDKFAAEWNSWLNDEVTNPLLDAMWGAMTDKQANSFREAMELYSSGAKGLDPEEMQKRVWGPMQEALDVMESVMGPMQVPSELTLPDNMSQMLAEQVGVVNVAVNLVPNRNSLLFSSKFSRLLDVGNANGLNYVPNEGLYHLHQGERVVPAREVASRSFSSNLYVENMNMGGGMTADALAAAIAGRNRRMMAGYGS